MYLTHPIHAMNKLNDSFFKLAVHNYITEIHIPYIELRHGIQYQYISCISQSYPKAHPMHFWMNEQEIARNNPQFNYCDVPIPNYWF